MKSRSDQTWLRSRQSSSPSPAFTLLLCMLCACGTAAHDAEPPLPARTVVGPERATDDSMRGEPSQPAETAAPMVKPEPGGQSGSDSSGSTPCAVKMSPLGDSDATPLGLSLSEIHARIDAWLAEHGAVKLVWRIDGWKPAALTVTITPSGDATLLEPLTPQCSSWIHEPVRVHMITSDGLLDEQLDGSLHITPATPEAQLSLNGWINFDAALTGEMLASRPLAAALIEAAGIENLDAIDAYDDLTVSLAVTEGSVSGAMTLGLRDNENGDGTRLIEIAYITSDEPAPAARVMIERPDAFPAACSTLASETLLLEPPQVSYEDRLPALAGTWVLCAGDRAETVAIDHAGMVIEPDGSFVHAIDADGELVARHGFGHEGAVVIRDAVMGAGGNSITWYSLGVDGLMLNAAAGLQGAGVTVELSADRQTMRWLVGGDSELLAELVYAKSELAVREEAAGFEPDTHAGAAGCEADERGLDYRRERSIFELQALLPGSWIWCSGAPHAGDDTLALDADGAFRTLDAAGAIRTHGHYTFMAGNPPGTYYVQLDADDGEQWMLWVVITADAPRKLLVMTSSDDTSRLGVLSALP